MNTRSLIAFAAICATLFSVGPAARAQAAPAQSAAPAAAPAATSSSLLRPALEGVAASLAGLSADRWKLPKDLRVATDGDIESIRRDLDQTLPPLLTAADAAPDAVSAQLPVAGNVGALYDVMLRVTERAKIAAPPAIPDQLVPSLASLESARRTFADRVTRQAAAQERRIAQLQTALNTRPTIAATPQTVQKPCPTPPRAKRKAKTTTATQSAPTQSQ